MLPGQVVTLQSKWVGEVLAKFFGGAAKHWKVAELALQQFLPKDMILEDAVLSREIVPPLQVLQALLHRIDISANLERAATVLDPQLMAKVCKPLIKLTGMTGFKKLKGVCHEEVAAETLDAETASKAKEVESDAANLEGVVGSLKAIPIQDMTLTQMMALLSQIGELRQKSASLPVSDGSRHKHVRDMAASVIEGALGHFDHLSSQIPSSFGLQPVISC